MKYSKYKKKKGGANENNPTIYNNVVNNIKNMTMRLKDYSKNVMDYGTNVFNSTRNSLTGLMYNSKNIGINLFNNSKKYASMLGNNLYNKTKSLSLNFTDNKKKIGNTVETKPILKSSIGGKTKKQKNNDYYKNN